MFCPDQKLMAVAYPIKNPLDITMHKEETIAEPGEKSFTVIIEQGLECACDVLIVAMNNRVDNRSIYFSKFT